MVGLDDLKARSKAVLDPLYAACRNALVEDHSGGYRVQTLRPTRLLIRNSTREIRSKQAGPVQVGTRQVSRPQVRIRIVRPRALHPTQIGAFKIRAKEVCPHQTGSGQVRPLKAGRSQVRSPKLSPNETTTVEVRPHQVGYPEVGAFKIRANERRCDTV